MSDIERWIKGIETIEPPAAFERRRAFPSAPGESPVRRLGVVLVAGALAAAGVAFAVVVLSPRGGGEPAGHAPAPRVSPRQLGTLPALVFVDDTYGWAAGDGVIAATSDGGDSWTRQYAGPADIASLEFVDASHGWAVAPAEELLRTTDGGATWAEAGEPEGGSFLRSVDFADPERGFGLASDPTDPNAGPGTLVRTTDGGQTWTVVRTDLGRSICVAGTTLYAGAGPTVLRSTDGGSTWTTVLDASSSETPWFGADVRCPDPSTVWVLFTGDHAAGSQAYAGYRSSDGGDSWSPEVVGTLNQADPHLVGAETVDAIPGPFALVSSDVAVFLGQCPACDPQHVTVVLTRDAGATWERRVILGSVPTAVSFADADHGWIAAEVAPPGRGTAILTTSDGGRTWTTLPAGSEMAVGRP
jgi:photosystem II stability/assembly factor-like uncharacterized protein